MLGADTIICCYVLCFYLSVAHRCSTFIRKFNYTHTHIHAHKSYFNQQYISHREKYQLSKEVEIAFFLSLIFFLDSMYSS